MRASAPHMATRNQRTDGPFAPRSKTHSLSIPACTRERGSRSFPSIRSQTALPRLDGGLFGPSSQRRAFFHHMTNSPVDRMGARLSIAEEQQVGCAHHPGIGVLDEPVSEIRRRSRYRR